jgi:hypothetical protein
MNEPAVTRATIRIEYSDGSVHELDVPNPLRAEVDVTSPELPALQPFDPAYLPSIPATAPFWRVAMSMDVTPFMKDASRRLITVSEKPYVLDPALAGYLDWPLYFPDESVFCNKPGHDHGDILADIPYLATARRMTIREFLADVKKHAEETI